MQLKHFCGKVVEMEILDADPCPVIRAPGGDSFGPIVAGMMFWSFPECIVEASDDEVALLRAGGFIIDGR